MQRNRWMLIMMLGLVSSAAVVFASVPSGGSTALDQVKLANPAANLLVNPSFEGQYSSYIPPGGHPDCPLGICQTVQMASGWTPWWVSHDGDDPNWIIRNPEYKPAAPWENRIHEGDNAQQYFTFHSTHRAGFYQRVSAQAGKQYRFTIWGQAWVSSNDNPDTSDVPVIQRIGIDPKGGTDWESSNVVWSPAHQQHDEFGLFTVCAVARSSHITVFTFSEPEWPGKHNDVYWDDAQLITYNEPCQLGMQVNSPQTVGQLSEVDNPETKSQPISIILPKEPGIVWEAKIEAGGTLTPTLSAPSGSSAEPLVVTIDSTGFPIGNYGTSLSVISTPGVPGSPTTIPVKLTVVEKIFYTYIPLAPQN